MDYRPKKRRDLLVPRVQWRRQRRIDNEGILAIANGYVNQRI
jgi:hypothetical protein